MPKEQGTPAQADTKITLPTDTVAFRQLVTTLTHNEDGSKKELALPEDTDIATKLAIEAEVSRRNTQAQHTKVAQDLALTKKQLENLSPLAKAGARGKLSEDEIAELDALKETDIDAWRQRYNELEKQLETRSNEAYTQATTIDEASIGLVGYEDALSSFNSTLEKPLTQQELDNELPPKYINAVKAGTLTYDEYLVKASELLREVKVTTSTVTNEPVVKSTTTPTTSDTYNPLDDDDFTL